MAPQIASWWRETGRLLLRYLAVGASFIPAGLIYARFRSAGWDNLVSAVLSLGLGLWAAHYVWNLFEALSTEIIFSEQAIVGASAVATSELPGKPQLAVIGAAYICSVVVLGIQRPPTFIGPNRASAKPASRVNTVLLVGS